MHYEFWIQAPDGAKEKVHEQDTEILFEKRERVTIDGARYSIQMVERRMASGQEIITDIICERLGAGEKSTGE